MPTYYFEITVEGQDIIKQLYKDDTQDLLEPWYSALSDVYGQKTTSYDGYMSKASANSSNELKLQCYVLEDAIKARNLKSPLVSHVEDAIKTHIDKLNIRFKTVLVKLISY
jgi:hypothetical protein